LNETGIPKMEDLKLVNKYDFCNIRKQLPSCMVCGNNWSFKTQQKETTCVHQQEKEKQMVVYSHILVLLASK
jgi:hypothetical protein